MSLSEIQSRLYKRGEDNEINLTQVGDRGNEKASPASDDQAKAENVVPDAWENSQGRFSLETLRILRIGAYVLGGVVFVVALVFLTFWYRSRAFSEDKIVLSVSGPEETLSGKRVEYEISFENQNRADIENAVLKVNYPDNFIPDEDGSFKTDGNSATFQFGKIESGKKGKAVLPGKVYAPRGALIYLRANLDYIPANFNSRFIKESQIGVKTTSSPIVLEVSAPQGVSDGGLARYEISYRNESDRTFEDLRVKAAYPSGFSFSNAKPGTLEGNDYWIIGNLSPGESGKIMVEGSLSGQRDEVKRASFSIGSFEDGNFTSFNDGEFLTKIVASPISIIQHINERDSLNVVAGELLRFEIIFRNEGNIGLRDVIVAEKLEGEALDFSTLDLGIGGNYDSDSHTITWRASEYPALANILPNQEGRITFSIAVKERLPVDKKEDRNFTIKSLAKVDSPDIPTPIDMNKVVSSNLIQAKVKSPAGIGILGFYNDSAISNFGPIPPKVGEETTYTMHWRVYNISNDLENATVSTFLPSGVVYTGVSLTDSGNLEYNSRTNELVWKIGEIEAGTGVLQSMKEIAFQIKIKPSIEQVGKTPKLLGESILKARDVFCDEDVSAEMGEKTSSLREDGKLPIMGDKVVN